MSLISLFTGYFLYPGSFIIYILFSVIFCGILFLSLDSKNCFLVFIGILFWLGFWFKLTFSFYLNSGKLYEPVGFFDYSASSYDASLIVSCVGILGLYFSQIIGGKKSVIINNSSNLNNKSIIFLFILTFSSILYAAFLNTEYSILQRAVRGGEHLPIIIKIALQWFIFVGGIAILIWLLEKSVLIESKYIYYLLFVVLFSDFIINTTMLSRVCPLTSGVIIYLFFKKMKELNVFIPNKIKIYIFLAYVIFSFSNVITTGILRSGLYNYGFSNITTLQNRSNHDSTPVGGWQGLLIGRWVGIEGVVATEAFPYKNYELIKESFFVEKDETQPSFYDQFIVFKDTQYLDIGSKYFYGITLPGIIGYLNYSGSLLFIFLGTFLAGYLFYVISIIGKKFQVGDMIIGYIGYLFAYRYASFGYLVADSYKFFFSILFLLLFILLFQKFTLIFFCRK